MLFNNCIAYREWVPGLSGGIHFQSQPPDRNTTLMTCTNPCNPAMSHHHSSHLSHWLGQWKIEDRNLI